MDPITFSQEDSQGVHHPHCDALEVRAIVAWNELKRMLVGNGSLVNILFRSTFNKMQIEHGLVSMTDPIFKFTGDNTRAGRDIDMIEAPEEGNPLDELDPQIIEFEPNATPMEELETFPTNSSDPNQLLRIGKALPSKTKEELMNFLKRNLDVFAWKHEDIVRIDLRVSCHHLNINPICMPHRQKRRALNPERYKALKEEVDKLSRNGFIREAIYPKWISNPVLVKKSSGKWRVVDFTNLNKACPKDSFPFPRID
ncbi:uncharacterized protein LOC111376307 [Olea europaea var. sylvestris]|uniref:uncharacterized protein LOC111376307 n=1 Tax=Olea europaea var. sylvestris TaxID=158386 RepID=UPI000C1CE031|nr:uncharacterized protein LOC111376307 [Olea europaea var. sylvestris]